MENDPSCKARMIAALIFAIILAFPLGAQPGEKAYKEKELSEALSKFQSTKASFAKGRELFASGDLSRAAREFEACIKVLPEHIYASYYLANVHYVRKEYTQSLAAIGSAERHLDFMTAVDAYAQKNKIQEMEEAKKLLKAENEVNSSCRESRRLEQMVLDVETEEEKAMGQADRDKLFRQKQASRYAYFHGNVAFQLKKLGEAFQCYNRAIQADPQNGDAYNNAASILFLAGRPQEADLYIQKAVAAGVEDRINLKLKKLITEGLGKSSGGILEQEFGAEGGSDIRVMRFSINPYEGQPDKVPFFVNSYVAFDSRSQDAVIIDPGAADPRLEAFIEEKKLKPRLILNTHGHYDHSHGNAHYARIYGIKIAVPKEDASAYNQEADTLGERTDLFFLSPDPQAGTIPIKCYPTPGHTPGGVCFLIGDYLFSGDSLFEDSVGRVSADSRAEEQKTRKKMIGKLNDLLAFLPAETQLLPGHGRATTLARVKDVNPFLKSGR